MDEDDVVAEDVVDGDDAGEFADVEVPGEELPKTQGDRLFAEGV